MPNFSQLPDKAPRREAFWSEEDQGYLFRGSFFGGCLHSLVLALRGNMPKKPDQWTAARYSAGSSSEVIFKEKALALGIADLGYDYSEPGVLWDAGETHLTQRKVKAFFMRTLGYRGQVASTVAFDGPAMTELEVAAARPDPNSVRYIVQSSLDGWGLGCRDWVRNSAQMYDGGRVALDDVTPQFTPWTWEHKTMNTEKKAALDDCCRRPYVLDPLKFRELMRNYGWQFTGQMLGVRSLLLDIFPSALSDPTNHLQDLTPRAFLSVDVLQQVASGEYVSLGYYLYYLPVTPYTADEVLVRLSNAVGMAHRGEVPVCDSEWGNCPWGFGTPKPGPRQKLKPGDLGDQNDQDVNLAGAFEEDPRVQAVGNLMAERRGWAE